MLAGIFLRKYAVLHIHPGLGLYSDVTHPSRRLGDKTILHFHWLRLGEEALLHSHPGVRLGVNDVLHIRPVSRLAADTLLNVPPCLDEGVMLHIHPVRWFISALQGLGYPQLLNRIQLYKVGDNKSYVIPYIMCILVSSTTANSPPSRDVTRSIVPM